MSTLVDRDLYGGAIKVKTPPDLVDASHLRQIPDNQEVFLYPESGASIIVEILQKVEASDNAAAVRFHFDSLAHDNDASSSEIHQINIVLNDRGDRTPSAIVLSGIQLVSKFDRPSADEVQILMALYRIEEKPVDLVVTFNIPTRSEDGGAVTQQELKTIQSNFETFVKSLCIVDFGLFA